MSSTPNLPQIETAIVDAIAGIVAGVGSYNYTVASSSISRVQREITQVPEAMLPAVDVAFQGEDEPTYQPGTIRKRARWLITGYVGIAATDEAAAATERMLNCSRLKDDLKAALLGSASLHGGVAAFVTEGAADNTTSQPGERDSRGSRGTLRFLITATYFEPVGLTPTLS